ncbi:MAG: DNA repair protein RecN, partial [Nitrospirota bacterium]|nr:DNA repair protein RecN [Nitrospirota bacterium]
EEFLRFQLEELSKARLKVGEEEELLQEHRRLKNSSALLELSNEVYTLLLNDDQSILSQLNLIKKNLDDLMEIDASTKGWGALAEGALAPLQELALAARSYRESFDHEPHALESLDERLATIQRLKKKYRESEEGLISKQGNLQAELEQLTNLEARLDELEQALTSKNRQARGLAKELSVSRSQVAQKLEKRIATELASLKMKGTKFRIQISKSSGTEELGPTGLDQVEFGFCANPGEAVQPLNRVVSGGELSRLMLAIKTVLANVDRVSVLIFDEVDTGIGGHVAAVMGQRLRTLGQSHQVFGITHLPQIASQANAHFKVEKQVVNHRTVTTVISLKPKEREEEIARMLGGTKVTQTVRKAAAEMLKTAPL